jgi:serine/threonine protein phosphatase 1
MSFTFAIGDIHGCHAQLQRLLESIEAQWPAGRIIFLGDYIDRGPDSRAVVERIMAGPTKPGWEWTALKGNHEAMMVAALKQRKQVSLWLDNGGSETLDSFGGRVADHVVDWMDALPTMICDQQRIFVHACVDEALPLDKQPERTLLWSRPVEGHNGRYWGMHLCHGHTPAPENPITIGNRTNIDSGCVYGGSLTAAVFDDDTPGAPVRFVIIPNRSVF